MITASIIDTHCHLDFDTFDKDRDQVIDRAIKNNIKQIIIPATQRKNWEKIQSLCADNTHLYACYGLHPYWINSHTDEDIDELNNWASKTDCIGIGECGLDYRDGQADKQSQLKLFETQLDITTSNKLPITIHSINATEDIINLIKKYPGCSGKMHSYTGSYQQALQLIELGFYISFGGTITYKNATKHRNTASKIPLGFLMIESNAPDQPDSAHKDQRNEPKNLINTLKCLSELREETIDDIAKQTTLNAKHLFNI